MLRERRIEIDSIYCLAFTTLYVEMVTCTIEIILNGRFVLFVLGCVNITNRDFLTPNKCVGMVLQFVHEAFIIYALGAWIIFNIIPEY